MRALPLLVTACAFCCSIADTASLPSLPAPKNWLAQHRALLSSARTLQGDNDGASASAAPPPSWRRLWDELRATQQLAYSAPASVLSLGLTASELVIPRLRGNLFDAAVTPGAAFAPMWPTVSAPYPGASRALLSHLRRPYSHVRARPYSSVPSLCSPSSAGRSTSPRPSSLHVRGGARPCPHACGSSTACSRRSRPSSTRRRRESSRRACSPSLSASNPSPTADPSEVRDQTPAEHPTPKPSGAPPC